MAQKFGNGRWVKEGYLDNRVEGCVVGRITFAVIGSVDLYLTGNCRGEIQGKAIRFCNSRYEDDDVAGHVIGDMENPQVGSVNLISFDPHPNLQPHPYIEWFSERKEHYRIELAPEEAWVLDEAAAAELDQRSADIRATLGGRKPSVRPDDAEWV
jgi:hypothetical protein